MSGKFRVERIWFPAGESNTVVDTKTFLLALSDSRGTFVEWSADGSRERQRSRVLAGDLWVLSPGQVW